MIKNPSLTRSIIQAMAALGDPQGIPWLIRLMAEAPYARVAGEAFSRITGIELNEKDLTMSAPPEGVAVGPNDDPADSNVDMDRDERLPWPDVARIQALWQQRGQQYPSGQRLFRGEPITVEHLYRQLSEGDQRTRYAAASELALQEPQRILLNIDARVNCVRQPCG